MSIVRVLLVTAFATLGASVQEDGPFSAWKKLHNKTYTDDDEPFRKEIFEDNVGKIAAHNSRNGQYTVPPCHAPANTNAAWLCVS